MIMGEKEGMALGEGTAKQPIARQVLSGGGGIVFIR